MSRVPIRSRSRRPRPRLGYRRGISPTPRRSDDPLRILRTRPRPRSSEPCTRRPHLETQLRPRPTPVTADASGASRHRPPRIAVVRCSVRQPAKRLVGFCEDPGHLGHKALLPTARRLTGGGGRSAPARLLHRPGEVCVAPPSRTGGQDAGGSNTLHLPLAVLPGTVVLLGVRHARPVPIQEHAPTQATHALTGLGFKSDGTFARPRVGRERTDCGFG